MLNIAAYKTFYVFGIMSLQRRQKLLGLVMGMPSGMVIIEATPAELEKASCRACVSFRSKRP